MSRPDGTETQGTGCHKVAGTCRQRRPPWCVFDRTGLYRELSGIEIELRRKLGFGNRIKMTIAEMITTIEELLSTPG